jgi:glucose-6-phosphate 1-dehydrogenase
MDNPFRELLVSRSSPEPCSVVIFGATGDLTHRKLIPALYNLAKEGDLPPGSRVIGVARREKSNEEFREELREMNRKVSRQGHDDALWDRFAATIFYHRSEFNDPEGFQGLSDLLVERETAEPGKPNRLFYLASAPEFEKKTLPGSLT